MDKEIQSIIFKKVLIPVERKDLYSFYELSLSVNEDLKKCSKLSLINCLYIVKKLKLSFVDKECYVIPYWNKNKKIYEAQLQISYIGMVNQLRRLKLIKEWKIKEIYNDDVWNENILDYENKTDPLSKDKKELKGYFIRAILNNNQVEYIAKTKAEIIKWANEYSYDYKTNKERSIWGKQFNTMALKTITKMMLRNIIRNPSLYIEKEGKELLNKINTYDQSTINNDNSPFYIDNQKEEELKPEEKEIIEKKVEETNLVELEMENENE